MIEHSNECSFFIQKCVVFGPVYNRQNQMSPFCKTKRLKNSAHIHTEADIKTMPASAIL